MKDIKTRYQEAKKQLAADLAIKNDMAVPAVTKVVINMGTGETFRNKEAWGKLQSELAAIAGQKPKIRQAHISVAGFNLRAGMSVGLSATLRGEKMWSFLEKLIAIALPRLRDFRGVSVKSFDNSGNYTIGFAEHTVFPEVDIAKIDKPHGLEVTIVTTAKNPKEGKLLLGLIGMPFEKEEEI